MTTNADPAAQCSVETSAAEVERARVLTFTRARAALFRAHATREVHDADAAGKWAERAATLEQLLRDIERGAHADTCPPTLPTGGCAQRERTP